MNCTRCGRELQHDEVFCLNCGEPAASAVDHSLREKPSDVVTCLVIGLFVLFGIPALLFGGYLLAVGTGFVGADKKGAGNGMAAILVSLVPLGVFAALLYLLIKVRVGVRREHD